jgi:hypothetical protein
LADLVVESARRSDAMRVHYARFTRGGTVAHSPAAMRWPANDEVFAASSSEHPRWRQTRWGGEVLTVEGRRR